MSSKRDTEQMEAIYSIKSPLSTHTFFTMCPGNIIRITFTEYSVDLDQHFPVGSVSMCLDRFLTIEGAYKEVLAQYKKAGVIASDDKEQEKDESENEGA